MKVISFDTSYSGSRPFLESVPTERSPIHALDELAKYSQWVVWRPEIRNGRATKVPYSPVTGGRASVTDPSDWATYEEARRFQLDNGFVGLGFVFCAHDPFTGVDLDDCRDPHTGLILPWAQDLIRQLDSYTEISPSQTGVKVWVRARVPGTRRRKGDIEMYDQSRYFTFTGQQLAGTPATINDRQAALDKLYGELFGPPEENVAKAKATCEKTTGLLRPVAVVVDTAGDGQVLRKAMLAQNGYKFCDLYEGRWESYSEYPSQSEADLALCRMLAYWTDRNPKQMDRLFRKSGLMRPKWDQLRGERTYGEWTIQAALKPF